MGDMMRNLGRDYIQSRLHEDITNVDTLVEEAMRILNEHERIDKFKNRALSLQHEEVREEPSEEGGRQSKKRIRNEWTEKEDEDLIAAVTAGKSFTEISKDETWKHRDRKCIANHYYLLQRRAIADHRELPRPPSLRLPLRPFRSPLVLSSEGKEVEGLPKPSEEKGEDGSDDIDRLKFTSKVIKRHCRGH